MKDTTESLIKALRILVRDIQSDDGVANCVISQAADRLEELTQDNHELHARWRGTLEPAVRIKQLEEENDAIKADLLLWTQAKEDK